MIIHSHSNISLIQIMENNVDSFQRKRSSARHSRGALSDITEDMVIFYYEFLTIRRKESQPIDQQWLQSIEEFKKMIQEDPILRMNWEYGIFKCKKTLPGKTGNDVFDMINTACKTPPSYSNSEFIGFPINAIFLEFMQSENGRFFFSQQKVNHSLKNILADYTSLLISDVSLEFMNEKSPSGWFCEEAREKINYQEVDCDPNEKNYGFKNWNQWFLRKFKPGKREIGVGSPKGVHDNIIINSCESIPLTFPLQPQTNVNETDKFWLKDDAYSLTDMFGSSMYHKQHLAMHFAGGTVYQAFLSALFYHRWHAPVDGVIEDIYAIPGTYYFDQSQFIPYDEESPNNSQSFLSSVSTRKVVVINSDNHLIGKVAIIYIGMAEVSSCVTTVNIGDHVRKGDEIGHFEFGGSSHVIVFEKNAKILFNNALYIYGSNGQVQSQKQSLNSYLAQVFQ